MTTPGRAHPKIHIPRPLRTYLDTHVAAWLYAGRVELLSKKAKRAIEDGELLVSPAVTLELQYLYETKRAAEPGRRVIEDLRGRIGVGICDLPFDDVIGRALDHRWTRDPFDRIIVGQASLREAALLSKDRAIRSHYARALW